MKTLFMLSIIYSLNFSFTQLLLYGVQVGHSFANSIFYASWLVFSYCQKILILNLYKTFLGMRSGLIAISAVCKMGGPVWFVNLDSAAGIIVRSHAKFCGEFSVTSVWINGLISNYNSVYSTFAKFKKIAFNAYTAKNKNALSVFKPWYFTRGTWPRAVFVSSVHNSYSPTKEALQLCIPCLGIVDTNTYTHVVSIPIPGNDESIDCLVFYNDFIAQFILSQKYLSITSWFFNVRKGGRFLSFKAWLLKKGQRKNPLKNALPFIKFSFNFVKHFNLGMQALFSQNKKYMQGYDEHLKVFEENDVFKSAPESKASSLFLLLLKSREHFVKLTNVVGYQKAWFVNKYIKTRFFKGAYFKKNLLNKKFIESKLIVDRFYKTHLHWSNLKFLFLSKFLKFYLFYNFTHYVHLTRHRVFPGSGNKFLSVIYFKLFFDYFNNPSHPSPIKVYKKKEYTKHFNLNFYKNPFSKYASRLQKFKKALNFKVSPKMFRKRKTFYENDLHYIKQISLLFKRFLNSKMPLYCKFLKKCLPKRIYKKNEALIKSYFINKQKEKLAWLSYIFIINHLKLAKLKSDFNLKIKALLNKKQKRVLHKIFEQRLYINNDLRKYTNFKHNKYFAKSFVHHPLFSFAYKNFNLFVKFFIFKNKKFKFGATAKKNLKASFQKMYDKYKFNYISRNVYLSKLEMMNISRDGYSLSKKAAKATSLNLKDLNKRKKGLLLGGHLGDLDKLKMRKKLLVKSSLAKLSEIKKLQTSLAMRYSEIFKKLPNPIDDRNDESLSKLFFFRLTKKYGKKRFNLNFMHRLNLLKNQSLKKKYKIFSLRKPFNFKRILSNFRVALGWLIVGKNFKIKFPWKYQASIVLFPLWYFTCFPSFTAGNKEFYMEPIRNAAFAYYKNFSKTDSPLSKFFYLTQYSPYAPKFGYIKKFLTNYSVRCRSKNLIIKSHHVFINNISLNFKRFIKVYGHIWL